MVSEGSRNKVELARLTRHLIARPTCVRSIVVGVIGPDNRASVCAGVGFVCVYAGGTRVGLVTQVWKE